MRILYGVVGEGMGHATRSRVVIDHLLACGHELEVVVSGRAATLYQELYGERPGIHVRDIHGLTLAYSGNRMSLRRSIGKNLLELPGGVVRNVAEYFGLRGSGFRPELVISDFDSWSWLYGMRHELPVISIDNMQALDRCELGLELPRASRHDFQLAKAAVKAKLPGCRHYIITGFHRPTIRKPRTTLVPPVLRPEVLAAKREPGEHVLVYQTQQTNDALLSVLRRLPVEFRIYGLGRDETDGSLSFRPFSQQGFIDDLRTAKAVVAGGGFSLMSEAVHLRVPMLSAPIEGQFEQEYNARTLEALGYGRYTPTLTGAAVESFLAGLPAHERALESYRPADNSQLLESVDALIARHTRRRSRAA